MTSNLKSRSDVTAILMLFAVMAVIGIGASGFVVSDFARSRASLAWPVSEGVVLSRREDGRGRLRYAYHYDGETFQSGRKRTFAGYFIDAQMPTLRPGDYVQVHVNPRRPEYAVLHPGGSNIAFVVAMFIGTVCSFLGIGGVVWTLTGGARELADAV